MTVSELVIDKQSDRKLLAESIRERLIRKFLRSNKVFSARSRRILILAVLIAILSGALVLWVEIKSSILQSWFLSRLASEISFSLQKGASQKTHFPAHGPYDIRMGYTRIPKASKTMLERGFAVESQAVMSDRMFTLAQSGVFPTYSSKDRAGLVLSDRNSLTMYAVLRPERYYKDFESIPPAVLNALLFIENKEVLDTHYPYRNPAVEWDRFFRATLENIYSLIDRSHSAPGGSTIATQLEKYRHSPEGRTHSVNDKFNQMLSAALRAYQHGRDTRDTRKHIVHTYINSIPLAAFPGYGEVNGIGDGLWAWYATDFDSCNQSLSAISKSATPVSEEAALCYRKILSLFVAHRRPSYYLVKGRRDLGMLVDSYIRLIASQRIIPEELADAALRAKVFFRGGIIEPEISSFIDRKAVNTIRRGLSSLLGVPKMYDLDHMDLQVKSTIDKPAHDEVTRILQRLNDPEFARNAGLIQSRLLGKGDPSKVTYSLTLYERTADANLLRIQTDNFDGPFDINSGTRLDLGSTAKLRTLVTYLIICEELYNNLSALSSSERLAARSKKIDPIGHWAIDTINARPSISLKDFLAQALQRTYSASPAETFFTGGGIHTFGNFKKEDNGRTVTISEALRESINLPFIRLMRDIVRYYSARLTAQHGVVKSNISSKEEEMRLSYLRKFADKEGSEFLRGFYAQYRGLQQGEFFQKLSSKIKPFPVRHAAAYRYVFPNNSLQAFDEYLKNRADLKVNSESDQELLYEKYAADRFDLNDRGYIVKVHPLELWMVAYLEQNPNAGLREIIENSSAERELVYKWLFRKSKRRAQDVRIKRLIEEDAFLPIYKTWQKSGYPFSSMVPSLASAIGSSGDRPSALAELMGIILNNGIKLPVSSIEQLHFAQSTPYETIFSRKQLQKSERIFSSEVAETLKTALVDVVESGTARRLKGTFKRADGSAIITGGKTGTGDHQFKQFAPGGALISSHVISRTATFVFFIGDKYFGTVTAHVRGEQAAGYEFTSALAAEVLKASSPAIQPLLMN